MVIGFLILKYDLILLMAFSSRIFKLIFILIILITHGPTNFIFYILLEDALMIQLKLTSFKTLFRDLPYRLKYGSFQFIAAQIPFFFCIMRPHLEVI